MGNRGSKLPPKYTVTERHLELVAKHMEGRWNLLALDLNFQRKEIFEIEEESPTLEEQCNKMLIKWYQKLPSQRDAMKELTTALLKCERQDLVTKLSEISSREWRLVLVGKTGSGKSDTGNHILHNKKFKTALGGSSVTSNCDCGTTKFFEEQVVVVDTPGLFDTDAPNKQIINEIVKFVLYLHPGPHAVLVTIPVGRQTEENQNVVKILKDIFEDEVYKYMIVVFTRKDDLDSNNMTLDDYLKTIKEENEVKKLVKECHGHCIAFNNRANGEENAKQVQELLDMVKNLVEDNGGKCCTSSLQAKLCEKLLTDEDLQYPEQLRRKVKEGDTSDENSWMWQGVVYVASVFGYDWTTPQQG